ncbi:hypothetical protein AB0J63_34415 [Streptosporangium canum]|uniref:hypothetical protein n=1 Tax=Streptosporangium canum TaxID=324952 RepID=UPI00343E4DB2
MLTGRETADHIAADMPSPRSEGSPSGPWRPVKVGDLVEVVSMEGNPDLIRKRASWLVGRTARVVFTPARSPLVDVELQEHPLAKGRRRLWKLHAAGLKVLPAPGEEQSGRSPQRRPVRAGDRAAIIQLLHSHSRARAHGQWLIGQWGTILRRLRYGYVLVELDETSKYLGGARRWHLHLGDLLVEAVEPPADEQDGLYGVGLSLSDREIVRHALPPQQTAGLCGARVRPMRIDEWSPPFLPTLDNVCPVCVDLIRNGRTGGW